MTEGTLRARIKVKKQNKEVGGAGRLVTFSKNTEEELKEFIATMSRLGFNPSRSQLQDIVQDYVTIKTTESTFKNKTGSGDLFNVINYQWKKLTLLVLHESQQLPTLF